MSEIKYPCPCCGNLTLPERAGGTYEICPVCLWEDDPVQLRDETYEGGANRVSLKQARKNYAEFGACEESLKDHVREPLPEEQEGTESYEGTI